MKTRAAQKWFVPGVALFVCLTAWAPAPLRAQERAPYRVTGYELEVELMPATHQLRAQARLEVTADEPLASLTLHLNRNLKVERVVGAAGKALGFEQFPAADIFRVDLPQTLAAGQSTTLTVDYLGARPVLASLATGKTYLLRESRWFPQDRKSVV